MASICVHRAPRPPPDIAPGHISSRDVLLEDHRPATDLPRKAVRARLVPRLSSSCNSSDKAIGLPGPSRAHRLARWHRFVSIEHREPLQTSLQGTSARAMICRKLSELPHTAVSARSHTFLQFIWHGNRHSRGLQGISARAMASICVHRAPRTPPDSTPGHIRSRDDLKESVTSIDDYAFRDCTNLTSTYIKATSLSIYGVNTFAYCPTIIYVPLGSEETYKKGWSEYRSRIFGYDYSAAE